LELVVNSYASDPQAIELITKISIKADSVPSLTLVNGVLRHKNRVWIGKDQALQLQIIAAMHSRALGGHSGVPTTYCRLRQYFSWADMKSTVKAFVQSCSICQQAKPE
jgi:hypothetical protein